MGINNWIDPLSDFSDYTLINPSDITSQILFDLLVKTDGQEKELIKQSMFSIVYTDPSDITKEDLEASKNPGATEEEPLLYIENLMIEKMEEHGISEVLKKTTEYLQDSSDNRTAKEFLSSL